MRDWALRLRRTTIPTQLGGFRSYLLKRATGLDIGVQHVEGDGRSAMCFILGGIVLDSSDKCQRRIPGFSSLVSIDSLCLDNKELGGRANCSLIPGFLSELYQ